MPSKEVKRMNINQNSIEIVKNTRGFGWSLRAYGNNAKEILDNLEALEKMATEKVRELQRRGE